MIREIKALDLFDLSTFNPGRASLHSSEHSFTPGYDPFDKSPQSHRQWRIIAEMVPRHIPNPLRVICPTCRTPTWLTCNFTAHERDAPGQWHAFHKSRVERASDLYSKPFIEKCQEESEHYGFADGAKVFIDKWDSENRIWLFMEMTRCPLCLSDSGETCMWHDGDQIPAGSVHKARRYDHE